MRALFIVGVSISSLSCTSSEESAVGVPDGKACTGPNVEWIDEECLPVEEEGASAATDEGEDTAAESVEDWEIGGECVDAYGVAGFYDCSGDCYGEEVMSFIGDSFCDDGTSYVDLNCEEFSFDGGDC